MGSRFSPKVRIALLVTLLVIFAAVAHFSGLAALVTRERIAGLAASAGWLGVIGYVAAFAVGEIFQLPGAIFVVAAITAYGPWLGTLVAYVGMNVASMAVFGFGRMIAGRALGEITHPRVKQLMTQVETSPIRTAFLARGVLFVLPGIGYALALSPIRFRDYVIGSAIGLAIPSLLAALLGQWLLSIA